MKRTLFTVLFFISIFYCYSVDFECNVSEHSLIKYNKIPGKGQENPYKETSITTSTIVGKCGGSGTGGYNVYTSHLHISFYNMKDKLSPSDSIKTIKDKLTTRRNPLNTEDIKNDNKNY